MESKEKCEQIIQMFNGKALQGAKDPLLVKFADGGNKKKSLYKNPIWREPGDVSHSVLSQRKNPLFLFRNQFFQYVVAEYRFELRDKRSWTERRSNGSHVARNIGSVWSSLWPSSWLQCSWWALGHSLPRTNCTAAHATGRREFIVCLSR